MKILVVTPTFLPIIGGAELGIYEIYSRLGKRHDVRILTPELPKYWIKRHGVEDQDIYPLTEFEVYHFKDRLNLTHLKGQQILQHFLPPFSLSYIRAVHGHVKDFRPDVVNYHYVFPGGLSLVTLEWLTTVPTVLSLVGRKDVLGPETPFLTRVYLKFVINAASCVLPISNYCLRLPTNARDAKIIPYGVNIQTYAQDTNPHLLRQQLGIQNDHIVLFALQRLVKLKQVDMLIKSMPKIVAQYPNTMLIIGGKGPEEENLKSLARGLNIHHNIIFAGFIPEPLLNEYYAASDIFVFPSTSETLGMVMIQAMAAGKPVVAVNTPPIPETIKDRENGILASPNPASFAAAISTLIDNTDLRTEIAHRNRQEVKTKYDCNTIAESYERVFLKLIKA